MIRNRLPAGQDKAPFEVDWDRLAPAYPRQVWLERSSLRTVLEMIDFEPAERLLDVGTGTAALLESLSRRPVRPEVAVGVDPCRSMLARAGALPGAWQLREASGEALPFPDESFDVITASWLLHVLDPQTRRQVLSEAARVLRPGGRLATITIAPPLSKPARVITAPLRRAAERYPSRLIGLRPLDPGPEMLEAGLVEIDRRRSFRGYPALCLLARRSE